MQITLNSVVFYFMTCHAVICVNKYTSLHLGCKYRQCSGGCGVGPQWKQARHQGVLTDAGALRLIHHCTSEIQTLTLQCKQNDSLYLVLKRQTHLCHCWINPTECFGELFNLNKTITTNSLYSGLKPTGSDFLQKGSILSSADRWKHIYILKPTQI